MFIKWGIGGKSIRGEIKMKKGMAWLLVAMMLVLTACGEGSKATNKNETTGGAGQLEQVKLMLDYTPNTNHTGLYVAQQLGYFAEEGLEVDIIAPAQSGTTASVATNNIQFGVSVQETVTLARVAGLPVVSLAAIIQHNTSGFASPVEKNIKGPKDFEGKIYGGWGSPIEEATIHSIMNADGADFNKLNIINMGDSDFFSAVKRDIDFAWIYYAWTGIEAELRNEQLNMIYLQDYDQALDFYTPVVITNETMINENSEQVHQFMRAVKKGYEYAIENPDEAAELLLKAVPDLNADLVKASQQWLASRYQDDASYWGEQKLSVWAGYADWMFEHGFLEAELDAEKAFTNKFISGE